MVLEQDCCSQTALRQKGIAKMKTGDRFASFAGMQNVMKDVLGKKFPAMGAFIPHLPNPNYFVACSKHVFYNSDFPNKVWWNEFEGLTKAEVAANWNDPEWITSDATARIREIFSPMVNPSKPGSDELGRYHPILTPDTATKRLIFANFRESVGRPGNNFVFLGVYEYDMDACENKNGYSVDAMSFPLKACNMESNLITYPHCVWNRISDEWGE